MTGFGKATYEDNTLRIQVEIKSVNAKHADVNLQTPPILIAYATAWRNILIDQLQRGRIEAIIHYDSKQGDDLPFSIQAPLFKSYYKMLEGLAHDVGAPTNDIFSFVLKRPEIMTRSTATDATESEYLQRIEETLYVALQNCQQYRLAEGKKLASDIMGYLDQIQHNLTAIEALDTTRIDRVKARLLSKLQALLLSTSVDEQRLEQELVYHLDKLDITEEIARLKSHLAYFDQVMKEEKMAGKKLLFVVQEIGRELNTLGVKSGDAAIQQHIIIMKNELEKAKEQLQNIL
eukprot:gene291-380_t